MIELSPSLPGYAIGLQYHQQLAKLTKRMLIDFYNEISLVYKENIVEIKSITQDADPVGQMESILNKLMSKWLKIFIDKGSKYANNFVNTVDNHNKTVVQSSVRKILPDFKIKMNQESRDILNLKKAVIRTNVELIKSIPTDHFDRITNIVYGGIANGKGLTFIKESIKDIDGVTRRQANRIAVDQLSKATSAINNARYLEYGFKRAKWNHSSAGKTYRPSHVKADGEIYELSNGLKIDDEYIYPGELINCKCYATVVIE